MDRLKAVRRAVSTGGIASCIVVSCATSLLAQAREPATTPNPAFLQRPALTNAIVLKSRAPLPGSVRAIPSEVQRSGTELRVPLTSSGGAPLSSAFRVVSGKGRVEVEANKPVVALPQRGTTVLTSNDAQKIAADSGLQVGVKTPLPWMVVDTKPRAEDPHDSEVRTSRPYLGLATAIHWDAAAQMHIAQFQLGIDAEAGAAGKLEDPVVATLSVTCSKVDPQRVTLDQVGPAGEHVIQVSCAASALKDPETQTIKVRLAEAELPYKFTIPHQLGAPVLTSAATRVSGFGVGSVLLTVRNAEEDQTPANVSRDTQVLLVAEGVSIDPSVVTIPAGKSEASIEVRSRGIGKVKLRAAGERRSEPVDIDFTFPLTFLIATLLGGAAGGYLSSIRAKSKTPRRRIKLAQSITEGAIVGVLIVVALLVFPSVGAIPDWARSSAIGWLLTSALAGFVGSDLIERLAGRVFGKPKEERPSTTAA
jgi:hypothetical protein